MLNSLSNRKSGIAQNGLAPSLRAARWRRWTAFLAIVSFLLVFSAAATHFHPDAASEDACAVCAAVPDNVVVIEVAAAAVLLALVLLYFVAPIVKTMAPRPFSLLHPPPCGPPAG